MKPRVQMAVSLLLLAVAVSSLIGAGYYYGYARSHDIASFPCLGCLGLNPVFDSGGFVHADFDQPEFVLSSLQSRPVFLHYRTDICPACDKMDPVVDATEEDFGDRVAFIHINLDHANAEEVDSYDLYDTQTPGGERTGVPMFVTIYADGSGGAVFSTRYGVMEESVLASDLTEAIEKHDGGGVPFVEDAGAPVLELFVDEMCSNCPEAEEETILQMLEGNVVPIVFVTPLPTSNDERTYDLAVSRQDNVSSNLSISDPKHPLIVFGYGEDYVLGWNEGNLRDEYLDLIDDFPPAGLNSTMELSLWLKVDGLAINATGFSGGDCSLRIFVQEIASRYTNCDYEPIPMVALDARTFSVGEGEYAISWPWAGAEGINWASIEPNNMAVTAILLRDGSPVLTRTAKLSIETQVSISTGASGIALPRSINASVTFTVSNIGNESVEGRLTVKCDSNLTVSITPQTLSLGEGESGTVDLIIETGDELVEGAKIVIMVIPDGNPLGYGSTTLELSVRNEVVLPTITEASMSPGRVHTGDAPTVAFTADDDSGIASARVEWFICTDAMCNPVVSTQADVAGGVYSCEIDEIPEGYTSLHYKVVVVDMNGNVNQTEEFEVDVEQVEEEATFPYAALGLAALFAAVAAVETGRRFL